MCASRGLFKRHHQISGADGRDVRRGYAALGRGGRGVSPTICHPSRRDSNGAAHSRSSNSSADGNSRRRTHHNSRRSSSAGDDGGASG